MSDDSSSRALPRKSRPSYRDHGDFPSEEEIARRLSQNPKDWAAKAAVLEREGLPRIDPLMEGRFWPAVRLWFLRRYGLSTLSPFNPDGEENLNAL